MILLHNQRFESCLEDGSSAGQDNALTVHRKLTECSYFMKYSLQFLLKIMNTLPNQTTQQHDSVSAIKECCV